MKHLKKVAAKLDDHGRNGDSIVAHLNPREAALLKALGGAGTINPKTGLLEFYDGGESGSDMSGGGNAGNMGGADGYGGGASDGGGYTDPMGTGADYGMSPGPAGPADPMGTGADYTPSAGWSAPDMTGMGRGENEARLSGYGWGGRKVGAMMDNPIATAINFATSFTPVGALNSISGLVGGPTVGSMATAAGRSVGNSFAGSPSAPGSQFVGSIEGKTTGAMDASGDPGGLASPDGGGDPNIYNPAQSGPSGSGASPIAQALMGAPSNQFGGRMTYGALNSTYSPFGREYVSPWAYRG
jgi:hypothetical protein